MGGTSERVRWERRRGDGLAGKVTVGREAVRKQILIGKETREDERSGGAFWLVWVF